MINDRESHRAQIVEMFRDAAPASRQLRIPQIIIRGNHNLITLGSAPVVGAEPGRRRFSGRSRRPADTRWPQQILDAIRAWAVDNRVSGDTLCKIAEEALGRVVLTIEKLNASELTRVYDAVCSNEAPATRRRLSRDVERDI
jgi:hypothetical protein